MDEKPFRVWFDQRHDATTRRIQPLHHNYDRHPLMQLPALGELARELMPRQQCRFIRPGTTQASDFWHDPQSPDGRGIDDVFRDIHQPGSWVALYNVEVVPRYRDFLDEVLSDMQPLIEREQGRTWLKTGFIFISAPPSVTPFHIDRENNFWLQIKGRKVMDVWDHRDRNVVAALAVEQFIVSRSLDAVRLSDAHRQRSHTFRVGPGDGVYFPSTSPHMTRSDVDWVTADDAVSISIGVNFYTDLTRRHARVHQTNWALRKIGLTPREPGRSELADTLKAPLGRLLGAARYRIRGNAPPGAY